MRWRYYLKELITSTDFSPERWRYFQGNSTASPHEFRKSFCLTAVIIHKYQQPSAEVTRQGLVAFRLWSTRVMALVQSLFISFLHKIRRNRSSCRYTCCYLSSYASYTFPVTSTMLATYMLLRGCALAANSLLSPRPCCILSLVVRSTNSLASFPVLVICKCLASFPGRVLRERKNGLGTRLGFAT